MVIRRRRWYPIDTPSTGIINFTPRQSQVGTYTITVTVSDGNGGAAHVTFQLVVENVNDAPVIKSAVPINGTLFKHGEGVTFQAVVTDEDGDDLTFTWKEGETVLGAGVPFMASKLKPGLHTVTLLVSDGTATVEQTLTFEVESAPEEGMSVGALGGIAAAIIVAVVVVVALLFMRSRRGAQPPGPPKAADAPPPPELNEDGTPKIEIEYRET